MVKFRLNLLGFMLLVAGFCTLEQVYASDDSQFRWEINETAASLYDGKQLVFSFQYAFLDHFPKTPDNEPRRYAGDYLYPLNGIDGENLVEDAPKDHYHHHGVFWTWPGVFVHKDDGTVKSYDLWTSNTPIRQRFVKFLICDNFEKSAVLSVENGWFIEGKSTVPDKDIDPSKKGEAIAENEKFYGKKIMKEFVTISTRHVETFEGVPCRAIDIELKLIPTTHPVSLQGAEKKSYGGLTIRFRPVGKIGKDRFILTDEGLANDDMPEKRLRWADFTSRFGAIDSRTGESSALSGAAIFLSPDFPDFPPTWLTRYYGPLCVGFPGVIAQRFEPGKPIIMKSRIWIHKGIVSVSTLKNAYETWAEIEKGEHRK